jgi:hypothetical protein
MLVQWKIPTVLKNTDMDLFRSLASDLIQPRLQVDTVEEDQRAAAAFTASFSSAYGLSTHKLTLSYLNSETSDLDHFL